MKPTPAPRGFQAHQFSETDIDSICQRYENGDSTYRLARELGVTTNAILYHLVARGVPRRQRVAKPKLPRLTLEQRFWLKVEKSDGCWLWMSVRKVAGYGYLAAGRKRRLPAHRLSWELHNGPIPDGLWVLHHCDNPPCVRPDHLFLGTAKQNADDREGKGRHPHGMDPDKVALIGKARALRSDGLTYVAIGERLGVTKMRAYALVKLQNAIPQAA